MNAILSNPPPATFFAGSSLKVSAAPISQMLLTDDTGIEESSTSYYSTSTASAPASTSYYSTASAPGSVYSPSSSMTSMKGFGREVSKRKSIDSTPSIQPTPTKFDWTTICRFLTRNQSVWLQRYLSDLNHTLAPLSAHASIEGDLSVSSAQVSHPLLKIEPLSGSDGMSDWNDRTDSTLDEFLSCFTDETIILPKYGRSNLLAFAESTAGKSLIVYSSNDDLTLAGNKEVVGKVSTTIYEKIYELIELSYLATASKLCSATCPNGVRISVYNGDFTQHSRVDTIVVFLPPHSNSQDDCNLKLLFATGGADLESDFKKRMSQFVKQAPGDLFPCDPGMLQCSQLLCCFVPPWGGSNGNEEYYFLECLSKVLAKPCITILFTSVCSNPLNYPAEVFAENVISSITTIPTVSPDLTVAAYVSEAEHRRAFLTQFKESNCQMPPSVISPSGHIAQSISSSISSFITVTQGSLLSQKVITCYQLLIHS